MNRKNINKCATVLNIVCMIIISIFLISDFTMQYYESFNVSTKIGAMIIPILNVRILALMLAICINVIMNIIISVQNRKNKKLMITYLLFGFFEASIFVIKLYPLMDNDFVKYISILDSIEIEIYAFMPIAICVILAIIQLIFINHQEENNFQNIDNKKIINIILNVALTITLAISLISGIIFTIFYKKEDTAYNQYINDIKDNMKINFVQIAEERYFPVCDDGKWGYINDSGKIVIPCIYDFATEMYDVSFGFADTSEEYLVGIAIQNNDYLLISPNKKTINLGSNPLKWYDGGNYYNSPIERITKKLFLLCSEAVNKEQYILEVEKTKSNEYIYINGDTSMKFTANDKWESSYTVTIEKDNEKNIYKDEAIPLIDSEIYLFGDSYIPYYDKIGDIHGWYELDGDKHSLVKNWEILDIKDNILVVRNENENRVYFIDLVFNEYKMVVEEVMICTNGYIVKLSNGNYIYLDKELKQLTKEYDYIYSKEPLKTNSIHDTIVSW